MSTRIKLSGDTRRADSYRFLALRKHLSDALMLRSFQNLGIYRHTVRLPGGGMIDVVCHHNMNEILIHVPPRPVDVPPEPDREGVDLCVVSIGDDYFGHWFFLWNYKSDAPASGLQWSKNLRTLYEVYKPVDQDAVYTPWNSYGGNPLEVFSTDNYYGAGPFDVTWNCDDTKDTVEHLTIDHTYSHPMREDDITVVANMKHRWIDSVSDDSSNYWAERTMWWDLPFVGESHYGFFRSNVLKPIPQTALLVDNAVFTSDFAVQVTASLQENLVGGCTLAQTNCYTYEDFEFFVPPGNMRRTNGTVYSLCDENGPTQELAETKYRHGALPRYADDSTLYTRPIEERASTTKTWPCHQQDTQNVSNASTQTDLMNFIGLQTVQNKLYHCQVYLSSWTERKIVKPQECWDVQFMHALDNCNSAYEGESQDIVYVAAASDLKENPINTNEQFEDALTQFVKQVTERQRKEGIISDYRPCHGQFNLYFTNTSKQSLWQAERLQMMNFLEVLNQARDNRGLHRFRWNFKLEHAARRMALDTVLNKGIDSSDPHTGSDGSTVDVRCYHGGYYDNQYIRNTDSASSTYYVYARDNSVDVIPIFDIILWDGKIEPYPFLRVGENILSISRDISSPERAFEEWKKSDPHWDNMMDPQFRETALDIRYTEYNGQQVAVWVQVFGYNWYNEEYEP